MQGRRNLIVAATLAAALAAILSLPTFASAGLVGNLAEQVGDAVGNVSGGDDGSGGSKDPQAGTPPNYVPPLHGTDPHGEGTVGVIDITPSNDAPLGSDPAGGTDVDEEIVVGRAVGSQDPDTGEYHGHITIAALFGQEVLGVDTAEGETAVGPLDPIQTQILDALCDGSNQQICIEVLTADSTTTDSGSTNHFEVADVRIGGAQGIGASVAESNGNISDDGTCQTAYGDSTVANASVGTALTADVIESSSESEACNDGSGSTTTTDGMVVNLNGQGIPLPTQGCEDGTPNTNFDVLAPLLSATCNAEDVDGAQAEAPYGVREGLSLFLLDLQGTPLIKVTTAGSESHATAPELVCPDPSNPACPPVCPDPSNPDCPPQCPDPGNPDCPPCPNPPCGNGDHDGNGDGDEGGNLGEGGGGAAGGPTAAGPGRGALPFTGADILTLALVGLGVMGLGLGGMALADRRRPWLVR